MLLETLNIKINSYNLGGYAVLLGDAVKLDFYFKFTFDFLGRS